MNESAGCIFPAYFLVRCHRCGTKETKKTSDAPTELSMNKQLLWTAWTCPCGARHQVVLDRVGTSVYVEKKEERESE